MKECDYYIGLDCGTESVGFAVTDTEYKVLKFNGKSMWGTRVFEEAQTAEARRMQRSARRRYQRKKDRIKLVQALFADEIAKVDSLFFQRINDSSYLPEDKTVHQPNSLFDDPGYKDADFFREFPTIFHLRDALRRGVAKPDPRLLYLAIHHIVKNRGHFLFTLSDNLQSVMELKPLLDDLSDVSESVYDERIGYADEKAVESAVLMKRITDKKAELKKLILFGESKQISLFADLIAGSKVSPEKLFQNEAYHDLPSISFREASFEEVSLPKLEDALTDDEYHMVLIFKAIYDWGLLADIMSGCSYISEAKIKQFDKNKEDLAKLKKAIKLHAPDEYEDFFHETGKGGFSSYIGRTHESGKNLHAKRPDSPDDFYKRIKKLLGDSPDDPESQEIKQSIEEGTFMPLLISFRNGVIPYQVNKAEMDEILRQSSRYFPFLTKPDENGLTVIQKLDSILTYRIPYYVGPLGRNDKAVSGWAVRLHEGKILPWNFNKMIDVEASAEKFIRNMTNKCTYIRTEDVLPKNSLLYSKFMVLNELNNVRINGVRLPVEQKQAVYDGLFKVSKKVTQNALRKFVIHEGWYRKDDAIEITGIDGDFKASLTSYLDFKEYLESKQLLHSEVEEIIKWLTIFSEGGNIVNEKIKKAYGDKLSAADISRISKLRYSGWGRLSEKFLAGIESMDRRTGELKTIISMMWSSQNNLMELLSADYEFSSLIESPAEIGKLDYSIVDELAVSPSVKRQIWQTLRIIDEIEHIMGHSPSKVFVEVTRSRGEKKATISRKNDIAAKLRNCREPETKALLEAIESFDDSIISRRDKLYLYFTQLGKCMYTGTPIALEDLDNTNIYDVDHIYPYSRSNDDSLTNRVLVLKTANAEKTNQYPINDQIRKNMTPFWKMLMEKGFIPREKYMRLTRSTPLTDADDKGFINRQLVETSQTAKATADIIRRYFGPDTKVVYSKAGHVSDFRKQFSLPKLRSMNNLHHAKDAYLNIVVGNVYDVKYTMDFIMNRKDSDSYYNLSRPFETSVRNTWIAGADGTIQKVRKQMSKNDILYTRQCVVGDGQLFDLMPVAKGRKEGALPLKLSDRVLQTRIANSDNPEAVYAEWTSKYGGYNSLKIAYFALVRHMKKKKHVVTFVPITIVDSFGVKDNEDLLRLCINKYGLIEPEIIKERILPGTMISLNGFKCSIAGRTGLRVLVKSAIPLLLEDNTANSLKKVEKFIERRRIDKTIVVDEKHDEISKERNIELYDILTDKAFKPIYSGRPSSQAELFKKGRDLFIELSTEDQCTLLHNMLLYFGMNDGKADLTLIKGTAGSGTLKLSENFKSSDSLIIYSNSVTGLFSKEEKIEI